MNSVSHMLPFVIGGGIFVLPAIGNPFMYLVSIIAEAIAGCLVLGLLKKNTEE